MFALLRAVLLALAVLFPLAVPAHGWGHHRRAAVASYYYAAPVGYYYGPAAAYPVIYSQPAPVVAAPVYAPASPPVYAVPTPAPAISLPAPTAPPPLMPPAAGVKESRSSYQQTQSYYLASTIAVASSTVPVAFWNRSNRDVWVWIAGERRWIRQGRGLTLDLPREFTWQVEGRDSQRVRVPNSRAGQQVVIP